MTEFKAQLSDMNPSKGLRLSFAMDWYGDQDIGRMYLHPRSVALLEQAARYTARQGLQPGDTSYVDAARLPELRRDANTRQRILLDDIGAQLRSGKLYATGFRAGQHEPTTIPREWWGVATLNPEMNTAEGNGVTFSGLLVFEAVPGPAVSPIPERQATPVRVPYTPQALAAWFRLRTGAWRKDAPIPTREQDLEAARAYFDNVPTVEFNRIRRDKTPESWRKQGPRTRR